MITPRFSCSQNDTSVVVSVYCPAVRGSEVEIHLDETLLSLHVAPYFLRLNFPASLVEDDQSSAVYDPASGYLTLTLTKQNPRENFPDLDFSDPTCKPTIEVLSSQDNSVDPGAAEHNEFLEAAANGWTIPQTISDTLPPYGFLNAYTGYFLHVATTENEINELGADAETLSLSERRNRRLKHEDSKWDPEHYMADFADDDQIEELLAWMHPHLEPPSANIVIFTEAENAAMLRLHRKEYLSSPQDTHGLYLTLLTLLFSYAYDARTTHHEPTPESAWTIAALTPAFSALDPPPYSSQPQPQTRTRHIDGHPPSASYDFGVHARELAETLIPSYRRALAFPLYRSWALAEACRTDVARFLMRGTRTVLRCLLELRTILDGHEVYYRYSRIWLDDFCRWIQACASEDTLVQLGQVVSRLSISKDSLGWDLVALESMVQIAKEGQPDSDDESERPALL
ncbi:SHQ1 protein-domain-containing protein [Multifurca ochricompacta]|uniref:SHQ1 protein-domain-containing protein n=1 Tax=Multifurca ochricompacta TaxID=376703 RepID=A0AAD4QPH8_9AGAM|nr:SHQ1 protein-domain-containing protein [Multifurca ochricompacta]